MSCGDREKDSGESYTVPIRTDRGGVDWGEGVGTGGRLHGERITEDSKVPGDAGGESREKGGQPLRRMEGSVGSQGLG